MNISRPFIARPVATTLVMVAVLLFGVLAFLRLPVAALPDVDFPTILGERAAAGRERRDHGLFGGDPARARVLQPSTA